MDGNLYRTHATDSLFNLVTIATGQGIQTIGVPTEGIFTPHIHDRVIGLENVNYVFDTARDLGEEIEFKPGGIIQTRAREVLAGAHELLERIAADGPVRGDRRGRVRRRQPPGRRGPRDRGDRRDRRWLLRPRERADAGSAEACLSDMQPEQPDLAGREVDLERVKPYADHLGDGIVQFSFTLPVPYGLAARKAAQELARKMGFEHPEVVHYQGLTEGYTYFVMYGECTQTVDYATLSGEGFEIEYMSEDEIEAFARERIGRPIVIVGAARAPTRTASGSTRCST